jgi:hypothetical protein
MEQIMRKIVLALSCVAMIACNNSKSKDIEKPNLALDVRGPISHEMLQKEVTCDENSYHFSVPNFNSNTDADEVLNHGITGLITKDFIDVTYRQGTPLTSLFKIFTTRRERILCKEQKREGLEDVSTIFISDNQKFTSYELEYSRNKEKGRLLKTFLKPELKEIHLSDIISKGKESDIQLIFDANLQQTVANLVNDIPPGDLQNKFIEHIRQTAFQFNAKDFKTCGLSFQFNSDISKNLRLSKKVALPKDFEFLNNTVVVEIDAYQLTHYLDLSRIIH